MIFTPNLVSLSYQAGGSTSFSVTATPNNPGEFVGSILYTLIVDKKGVLDPNRKSIVRSGSYSYTATLYTSSTLPAGAYQDSFELMICADSQCNQPFPGSPWEIPYSFTVSAPVSVGPGTITRVAGNGTQIGGFGGDNGSAVQANLASPKNVAFDASGNYYISDYANSRIRKVDTKGMITTVAGSASFGFGGDNGPATSAQLRGPWGVAVDTAGNVYFSDQFNNRIRKVAVSGIITTIAGTGANGFIGDTGPATAAQLCQPDGMAIDASGNLYVADTCNNAIRKITPSGIITTVAGKGVSGYSGDNGPAVSATLNAPEGVAVDSSGNIYIADFGNNRIRKVATNGTITTVAGNGTASFSGDGGAAISAALHSPQAVAVDSTGNIYISDSNNARIRKVDTNGVITTFAGSGTTGFSGDNGPAISADFTYPAGVTVNANGDVYITDTGNFAIRKVQH